MDFEKIKTVILHKLANELNPSLHYHNVQHTIDILDQCNEFAENMKVGKEDFLLLQTAALLHDVGYIWGRTSHEERSVDYAKKVLPDWQYSAEQIDKICNMILATRIPQSANTMLEQILCDSDLSYLGTNSFETRGNDLFFELEEAGVVSSKKEWDKMQVSFLKSHTYYTSIAKHQFSKVKQENLDRLIQSMNQV